MFTTKGRYGRVFVVLFRLIVPAIASRSLCKASGNRAAVKSARRSRFCFVVRSPLSSPSFHVFRASASHFSSSRSAPPSRTLRLHHGFPVSSGFFHQSDLFFGKFFPFSSCSSVRVIRSPRGIVCFVERRLFGSKSAPVFVIGLFDRRRRRRRRGSRFAADEGMISPKTSPPSFRGLAPPPGYSVLSDVFWTTASDAIAATDNTATLVATVLCLLLFVVVLLVGAAWAGGGPRASTSSSSVVVGRRL